MIFQYGSSGGADQIGLTQTKTNVNVTGGLFTIPDLDFGSGAFTGDARWLQIAVKCAGDADYTTLAPRQALTPAPYALYSKAAPWSGLSGVPAGFADNVDDDTTYTAGRGLTLSGGAFSISTTYRLPQTCPTPVPVMASVPRPQVYAHYALPSLRPTAMAHPLLKCVAPAKVPSLRQAVILATLAALLLSSTCRWC